jgi:hypothetical protein
MAASEEGWPLLKMLAGVDGRVSYALRTADGPVELAPYIGGTFTLRATGILSCVACGRRVRKLFAQGLCYPCLSTAPEASECIVRPELCQAHLGAGRDPGWERDHHATEHVVYLAQSSGIKVGVPRATQVPVRWIDQGAVAALVIARTPYRQLAGLIEVDLKRILPDRTNWRAMLRSVPPDPEGLLLARDKVLANLRYDLHPYLLPDERPMLLEYPVLAWPPRLVSVSLEKSPVVGGRLLGAKGQYLVWEDGRVLNVRNHSGHHVVIDPV